MDHFILDSNIIIKYPKLLGLKLTEGIFIITQQVLDELGKNSNRISQYQNIAYLIERALMDGTVRLTNPLAEDHSEHSLQLTRSRLSRVDYSLLVAASRYLDQGEGAKIATIDKEVIKQAQIHSIAILRDDEIQLMLQLEDVLQRTTKLNIEIKAYEDNQKHRLFSDVALGLTASVVVTSISSLIQTQWGEKITRHIFSTIQIWGSSLLFLILGILLYFWRERQRFSYGLSEFAVGLFCIIMVFYTNNFELGKTFNSTEADLKLVAGLYIMVRGQDNMVKSLKDTKAGIFLLENFKVGG